MKQFIYTKTNSDFKEKKVFPVLVNMTNCFTLSRKVKIKKDKEGVNSG